MTIARALRPFFTLDKMVFKAAHPCQKICFIYLNCHLHLSSPQFVVRSMYQTTATVLRMIMCRCRFVLGKRPGKNGSRMIGSPKMFDKRLAFRRGPGPSPTTQVGSRSHRHSD